MLINMQVLGDYLVEIRLYSFIHSFIFSNCFILVGEQELVFVPFYNLLANKHQINYITAISKIYQHFC